MVNHYLQNLLPNGSSNLVAETELRKYYAQYGHAFMTIRI